MKNIIYVSDSYQTTFKDNSCSKFKCLIEERKINYLPNDPISVAIKTLTFTIEKEFVKYNNVIGIESNLCNQSMVRSNLYHEILCTFTISNKTFHEEYKVVSITFENPIFFTTTKRNLTQPSFRFIDLTTNEELKQGLCFATPSIIQVVIIPQMMRISNLLMVA